MPHVPGHVGNDPNLLSRILGWEVPGSNKLQYSGWRDTAAGPYIDMASRFLLPGAETSAMAQSGDASTMGLGISGGLDLIPMGGMAARTLGKLGRAGRSFVGKLNPQDYPASFQELADAGGWSRFGGSGGFTRPFQGPRGRDFVLQQQSPGSPVQGFYRSRSTGVNPDEILSNVARMPIREGFDTNQFANRLEDLNTRGRFLPMSMMTERGSPVRSGPDLREFQNLMNDPNITNRLDRANVPIWTMPGQNTISQRMFGAAAEGTGAEVATPIASLAPLDALLSRYQYSPELYNQSRLLDMRYGQTPSSYFENLQPGRTRMGNPMDASQIRSWMYPGMGGNVVPDYSFARPSQMLPLDTVPYSVPTTARLADTATAQYMNRDEPQPAQMPVVPIPDNTAPMPGVPTPEVPTPGPGSPLFENVQPKLISKNKPSAYMQELEA